LERRSGGGSLVDASPDVGDVYGDVCEGVQFDDAIESGGWGFGVCWRSELVECGVDGDGSDGDGESGVSVYGMERGVDIDGEFCAGDCDGRTEGLDGEL
jgi:hypothetical protein